jgi:hypothetical protein
VIVPTTDMDGDRDRLATDLAVGEATVVVPTTDAAVDEGTWVEADVEPTTNVTVEGAT